MTPARKKADDIAGQAAAVLARGGGRRPAEAAPAAATEAPAAAAAPAAQSGAPRAKPIRVTIDLPPVQHRQFKRWCDELAEDAGLATVTGAEALRAALKVLLTDPDLTAKVRAAVQEDRDDRRRQR